jgi:hypothetical protein
MQTDLPLSGNPVGQNLATWAKLLPTEAAEKTSGDLSGWSRR